MSIKHFFEQIDEYLQRVNTEYVVLVVFFVVSLYIFIGSFGFSDRAASFPRITSGVALIAVSLLLIKNYLPEGLQDVLFGSVEIVDTSEMDVPKQELGEGGSERFISNSVFTGSLVSLYILSGYLFGLLWVSPVFVVIYMLWYRKHWILTIAAAVLVFIISWIFLTVVRIPIDEGLITALWI